jgi:hypothetical protein
MIMQKANKRKVYQKPSWQKQEMFERFARTCGKTPSGGAGCSGSHANPHDS